MDVEDDAADAMVTALTRAGVAPEQARIAAINKNQRAPALTFVEVYGRSVRNQSLHFRRNLSIKGLDALDLRKTESNNEPWNFTKKADRRQAGQLVEDLNPDWILGAPPCAAFAIWNSAMN